MKILALTFISAMLIGSCEEVVENNQMGLPKEITIDAMGEQRTVKCKKTLNKIGLLNTDNQYVAFSLGDPGRGETLKCNYEWLTIEIYPENPSELFITAEPNSENNYRSLYMEGVADNFYIAEVKIIQMTKQ